MIRLKNRVADSWVAPGGCLERLAGKSVPTKKSIGESGSGDPRMTGANRPHTAMTDWKVGATPAAISPVSEGVWT